MSGYPPPPPNQGYPPPGGAPMHGQFAPPPPGHGGGGNFPSPPPGGNAPGGYAPPGGAPGGGMTQLNSSMGNMGMQQRSPYAQGGPAPPGGPSQGFGAPQPPAPGFFQAPPAPGQGGPPPPGQFQPPSLGGHAPGQFQPPPAPGGFAPPPGPSTFHPPPPGAGAGGPPGPQMMQAPPPPGGAGGLSAPGASSPFYQQPPSQGQQQRVAAPAPPGGMPMPGGPATPIFNENIDFNIQIPDRLFRLTAAKLPQTASQASATKIPFGAILRPLAPAGPDEEEIDTVQPGSAGIIRCKRCRTYINAFVTWSEHGRRWRCNICAQVNDCPSAYFCHLDERGLRRDRFERPELSKGVVEFIAPAEYMVRPPQEPTFFFVLDVSATAVRSGMLASAAKSIKASLDDIPGRGRTKIGFITFDNSVHYYNLASDLSNPQMLVVSDLKELFVPLPDNLLVNLQESRGVVDAFLDSLPEMFSKNPVVSQSCLGPALKAAFTVMKQIGGKMCVFQSIMPNLGDGALKPREQPGVMGTPNEIKLLRPEVTWYKDTAVEFSRQQISVDMFLFPYQYMDLAALGELPKYTAGTLHSYVSFNQQRDGQRFEEQLTKTLTQTTAFEAVMRIRATKGMKITNFFGNFYIRGTDLLALPNTNTESVFGFDLVHDDQSIASNYVTIQAALLYTSSDGERRIRVMTQAIPVTSLTSEVVASINTDACFTLLAKQALQSALKSSLDNARMRLQQTCVEIIRAAKGGDKRTVSGYAVPPPNGQLQGGESAEVPIPENLRLLPLYTLALMKNVAFRGGTDVHPDERVQAHHILNGMSVLDSKHYIYPRMFAIHEMDDDMGHPVEEPLEGEVEDENLTAGRDRILLPPVVSLTVEGLTSNGVYLLDNGVEMFLWVGRTADMNVVSSLFGTHSLEDMDPNQIEVLTSGDSFAAQFGAVVRALREGESTTHYVSPKINVIREGDAHMEARFFWFMIEDRASFQGGTHSYPEFMQFVNNPAASSGPRGGAPGPPAPPGGGPGRPGPPGPPGPPGHPGMGMAPPGRPGMGMAPPAAQGPPGGYAPPPQNAGPSYAPPPQMPGGMQAPPRSAPANYSSGPPHTPSPVGTPPGGSYGAPPPGNYGAPPAQGPPSGGGNYGAPPAQGPPSGGGNYGAPPPGNYGAPPAQGPPSGAPAMPPPPGRAVPRAPLPTPPPPGGRQQHAPPPPGGAPRGPPPPPRGSMPPPPPPNYR